MSRVAFVTGGGGGIGAAICRALAGAGNRVVVADLSEEASRAVAAEVDGLAVSLDVTDPGSVSAAVQAAETGAGPIDVLVNCAGWERAHKFLDTDEEYTAKVLEINLAGPIRVTRCVLGGMKERGWGRIVNVSSDAGILGAPMSVVYSAAKGGLIAFTKAVARDAGRRGVTVNAVAPGAIDTPLLALSLGDRYEAALARIAREVPVPRVGRPEEVAAVVVFFASEEASYVTGQTVSAGGGQAMP